MSDLECDQPLDNLARQLAEAVEIYGVQAVQRALFNTHLFRGLRAQSAGSLRTAGEWWELGLPSQLIIALNPVARKLGERVEIRTITGDVSVAIKP